jgi:Flp pilus assembly protein TadD
VYQDYRIAMGNVISIYGKRMGGKRAGKRAAAGQDVTAAGQVARAEDWYRLGHAAETANADAVSAMRAYEQALACDPGHAGAHVNLGRLHHEFGDLAAAEAHYRRAVFLDPGEPVYWFNLGVVLEDRGRPDEAADAYRHCLALDAAFTDAHFNLSGVLERGGDVQGALRHLSTYRRLFQRQAG